MTVKSGKLKKILVILAVLLLSIGFSGCPGGGGDVTTVTFNITNNDDAQAQLTGIVLDDKGDSLYGDQVFLAPGDTKTIVVHPAIRNGYSFVTYTFTVGVLETVSDTHSAIEGGSSLTLSFEIDTDAKISKVE